MIVPDIVDLLKGLRVTTLLDAPCGDFNWAQDVAAAVDTYIGVDVVDEIISRNTSLYGGPRHTFLACDITRDPLPKADLILSRDCLVHFSFADIHTALRNFRASGAEYLLTTTFIDRKSNENVRTGGWRTLNLELPPFMFPPPIAAIDERCTHSGGIYRDKRLGLWRMDQIPG